jgi:hypothetical protein
VNLYGIISNEDFVELFNSQNTFQTNVEEVFTLLLPLILKKGNYCFYKDSIVHYLAVNDFELADYWQRGQEGKPRFIPDKDEFLRYESEYHTDENERVLWSKVFVFICTEWPDGNDLYDFHEELKEGSQIFGLSTVHDLLREYDLSFTNEKQIQPFFDLLNNAHNNTRMWLNKGHTPNELIQFEKEHYEKNGQDKTFVREHKKIGPNEPCPCGSGKKYKKCCRLVETAKTAQLNSSDCTLLYETWHGLLHFVDKKKQVLDPLTTPKPPHPVSDELVVKIREALWEDPGIIDEFLTRLSLPKEMVELLVSWRDYHIKDTFLVVDYKPDYAVLVGSNEKEEDRLYGVTGLSRSLADVLQRELPFHIQTVLLPFKDKIIYDGYIKSYNVSFGKNMRETFSEMYKNALKNGIITRLPERVR